MVTTNQFRNGNHIEVDGVIFKILEFQHVKPGKGGAFVRTKLRRISDAAVIDRTFRAGERFRAVRTESRKMQFLYADGGDAHFMDSGSYEQIAIPEARLAEPLRWTRASDEVDVLFIDDEPADIQLPSAVDLEVSDTEPGLRGDTASGGGTKPATLETGAQVQVPLFVSIGDRIRVDTRTGEYVSRA
jgi:elongation factor P